MLETTFQLQALSLKGQLQYTPTFFPPRLFFLKIFATGVVVFVSVVSDGSKFLKDFSDSLVSPL